MEGPPIDLDRVVHGTLLGDALNSAGIAALLADETGQYVAANDEACRLTGYSRSMLLEFRAGQLAADEASSRIYDNISRGVKLQGKKTIRTKDGVEIQCRYWAIPTRVIRMPYVILLLWPKPGRAAAA